MHRDAKRRCQTFDVIQTDIACPALDHTDIGPVQPGHLGQHVLRPPVRRAQEAYALGQNSSRMHRLIVLFFHSILSLISAPARDWPNRKQTSTDYKYLFLGPS